MGDSYDRKRNALSKVSFCIPAMFGMVWVYNLVTQLHIALSMVAWLKALMPKTVLYGFGVPLLLLILGKSSPRVTVFKGSLSAKQFLSLLFFAAHCVHAI